MRRLLNLWAMPTFLGLLAVSLVACGDPQAPVNRVNTNIVEKSAFTGSWYMSRTVIDMEYEGAPMDFIGDTAGDDTGGFLGVTVPRVRWVIDENFLYAYRDYETVVDPEDPYAYAGDSDEDYLGQPVAAFSIQSHFDIRRDYNTVTGEERNVLVENTADRRWYDRQFMRVDWSQNLLTSYFGNSHNLAEIFGSARRESAALMVQDQSDFPRDWTPQFNFMSCNGLDDGSEGCAVSDRDFADQYDQGELYSMSFVTQEVMFPGSMPGLGFPLCRWNDDIANFFPSAPECASVAIWVRTSFLRVSDRREYAPVSWTNDRFDRSGYFALDRTSFDRSYRAGDPSYWVTDFTNKAANRHNMWQNWFQRDANGELVRDDNGNVVELPYSERRVRPIVWYSSRELPAHLVSSSFELVSQWNGVFMQTVRELQGRNRPVYPEVNCQTTNPDGHCYCIEDSANPGVYLNPTCRGEYDAFESPEAATARGAVDPYDCYVTVPEGAEPDWNDAALAARVNDSDFNGWFGAEMVGSECVNVLRNNTCNLTNQDQWGELDCQNRGDIRYKLLSYVDQPGTPFLGIAQMRGDPITGEIITGDANIGAPAMQSQRSFALNTYDLMVGNITDREYYLGEDVRGYLESVNDIQQPARPRVDFSTALREGHVADPAARASIQNTMARAMERASLLQGPEGRAASFSSRRQNLVGTDIERRLLQDSDLLAMAGMDYEPEDIANPNIMQSLIDRASPFQTDLSDRLNSEADLNIRQQLTCLQQPNEYTDNSVLWFVNQHRDWPRARIEMELDRRLYRETQVHEMGHCLGLRHHFGGTADSNNYSDGYYIINDAIPLPDPNTFNTDGAPGLSPEEQVAYDTAYNDARRRRELAGIDQWMTSSVMDYTPNWYERINGTSRHDMMAISFGYGDIVDIYDNAAMLPDAEVHPVNTTRTSIKWYHGGESCQADTDCPFNSGGSRSADLLASNTSSGLVQTCQANPRTSGARVCSNFDDDVTAMMSDGTTSHRWLPADYFYCEDIRANTRSIPGCSVFDAGDSFREIVTNQVEAYERSYIFSAFRRYRRNFSTGTYFGRLFRYISPLLGIYTNLMYRYATEPEFRDEEGPWGFFDQFLATADTMNMLARMLAQPSIGSYFWDQGWQRYERFSPEPGEGSSQLSLDLGQGRHLFSVYQGGLQGINKVERVGAFLDTILAMQILAIRGLGPFYGPDVVFNTNFNDIFPNEIQQIFTGLILNRPEAYRPRIVCEDPTAFPRCDNPQIMFMDFYRGDCAAGSSAADCRPSPEVTYGSLPVLNGQTSFALQSYASIYALSEFPIYYDTSFEQQLFVCVEGQGDCQAPAADSVLGTDYVRYTSRRFGKSFLAWQIDSNLGTINQASIAFSMVKEASDSDFIIRMLQTYRGDNLPGDPPPQLSNLSAAEQAQLAALGYTIPDNDAALQDEIDRLDSRLRSLESFFNYLIQLERAYGINFPILYRRPEI